MPWYIGRFDTCALAHEHLHVIFTISVGIGVFKRLRPSAAGLSTGLYPLSASLPLFCRLTG
jgi:hypothetical protein